MQVQLIQNDTNQHTFHSSLQRPDNDFKEVE
jgi:hypothetical protein